MFNSDNVFSSSKDDNDPVSIIGVLLNSDDGFYNVATDKILKQLYGRSELTVCPNVDSV